MEVGNEGGQEGKAEVSNEEDEIQLKEVHFDDLKDSLARSKVNDKTLKAYVALYNAFAKHVQSLPTCDKDETDATIEKYIADQYVENKKPGNMTKMNQLHSMIRIIHPKIHSHLPLTKDTLNNWKHDHAPQSATAINSVMTRVFASYLSRSGELYAAAAIVIQQARFLRPIEMLNLKRGDVKLPVHLSLDRVKKKVIGLVINNGKQSRRGSLNLHSYDEVAVKLIEVLMSVNTSHPKTANLLDNTSYAHYNKMIQNAARYYCLKGGCITPRGARLGKAVETYNNRTAINDIALDGRWARPESSVDYVKNGQASFAKTHM